MLERIQHHPAGRFARCRACGAEPRHVRAHGRASNEPIDVLHPAGVRHRLECRCQARTALYADLAEAEAEWGADYAQFSLPLRPRRARAQAAA